SHLGDRRPHGYALQAADQALIDIAQRALVDARRVDEAIANHPMPRIQRGHNSIAHVIVSRSGKEDSFGFRSKRLGHAGEQDKADDLGSRRSAGLPREHNFEAKRSEPLRQRRRVSGFTAAFAAFKRNKSSAHLTLGQSGARAASWIDNEIIAALLRREIAR